MAALPPQGSATALESSGTRGVFSAHLISRPFFPWSCVPSHGERLANDDMPCFLRNSSETTYKKNQREVYWERICGYVVERSRRLELIPPPRTARLVLFIPPVLSDGPVTSESERVTPCFAPVIFKFRIQAGSLLLHFRVSTRGLIY